MLHPEGMTERFTAHVLFAEILEDFSTFLIVLADDAAAPTRTLELMKSVQADESDPDSDTYCVVLDGGAAHYGGLSSCQLTGDLLYLRFDDRATAALGTGAFGVQLDLSGADLTLLRTHLMQLFSGDRNAPRDLSLDQNSAERRS